MTHSVLKPHSNYILDCSAALAAYSLKIDWLIREVRSSASWLRLKLFDRIRIGHDGLVQVFLSWPKAHDLCLSSLIRCQIAFSFVCWR